MTTQHELIDLAKKYALTGGALSVRQPGEDYDGDGLPIQALYLDARGLRYATLYDDHNHIFDVRRIEAGDDGAVLVYVVSGDMVMRIRRGTDQQVERLALWRKRIDAGEWYPPDLDGGMAGAVVFGG
jgi:hypothetical protein